MSKISLMTHLDGVTGKYSKTDKVYTKVRKFDGQTIGIRMKNPATNQPPTAEQEAVQEKFTQIAAQVKAALADAEQKAALKVEWKRQRRCKTLKGYAFRKFYLQSITPQNP